MVVKGPVQEGASDYGTSFCLVEEYWVHTRSLVDSVKVGDAESPLPTNSKNKISVQ